ncbi:uncharacterized protein [Anabrus simplex]|uniref:uncharacterized protein n=1 Tax=Anabrus simplex TaxID=316456 RepID=UPI0035A2B19F
MTTPRWTRPDTVPFPSVWRRFEGKRAVENGKVPNFWVQDVTDDLAEDVVAHMTEYFLHDEPLSSTTKFWNDPVSVREIQSLWREMIKQRVALVALTNGDNGPVIAGCNVTGVVYNSDKGKDTQFEGGPTKTVLAALEYISGKVDVFQRYGVNEYMTAMGLSVHPAYRGQGIGIELLRARFDLGRAVGLKLTVTVFTAISSQILAHRIEMEVLAEVAYNDYLQDGQVVFPNMKTPTMKLMAKRIQSLDE